MHRAVRRRSRKRCVQDVNSSIWGCAITSASDARTKGKERNRKRQFEAEQSVSLNLNES